MKTTLTYNGYANRSTWLVCLHLDNTSKEVYDMAHTVGVVANTTRQFRGRIAPVLEECPLLWKEQGFDALEVNWSEVWDKYRIAE